MRKEIHFKANVLDLLSQMKIRIFKERNDENFLQELDTLNELLALVESWSPSVPVEKKKVELMVEQLYKVLETPALMKNKGLSNDWKHMLSQLEEILHKTDFEWSDESIRNASPVCFAKEPEVRKSFIKR